MNSDQGLLHMCEQGKLQAQCQVIYVTSTLWLMTIMQTCTLTLINILGQGFLANPMWYAELIPHTFSFYKLILNVSI